MSFPFLFQYCMAVLTYLGPYISIPSLRRARHIYLYRVHGRGFDPDAGGKDTRGQTGEGGNVRKLTDWYPI